MFCATITSIFVSDIYSDSVHPPGGVTMISTHHMSSWCITMKKSSKFEDFQLECICTIVQKSPMQIALDQSKSKSTCCQGDEYQPKTTALEVVRPGRTRGTSTHGPWLQDCWRSTKGLAIFLHLRIGNSTYLCGRGGRGGGNFQKTGKGSKQIIQD